VWFVENLNTGAEASINMPVNVTGTGYISNKANVTTREPNPPSESNITIRSSPIYNMTINKTVNVTDVRPGDYVDYTINVKNLEDPISDVNVTDLLDHRLIYQSDDDGQGKYNNVTGLWQIGELTKNESRSLHIICKVDGVGVIPNLAMLNTSHPDINKNSTVNITSKINGFVVPNIFGFGGFGSLLNRTGFPLLILFVLLSLCVGLVYKKRK
jgi:uncharacterized repeat protein (TIGR01451 family)